MKRIALLLLPLILFIGFLAFKPPALATVFATFRITVQPSVAALARTATVFLFRRANALAARHQTATSMDLPPATTT